MAALGDYYVNDAFFVSLAPMAALPKGSPTFCTVLRRAMEAEVTALEESARRPGRRVAACRR